MRNLSLWMMKGKSDHLYLYLLKKVDLCVFTRTIRFHKAQHNIEILSGVCCSVVKVHLRFLSIYITSLLFSVSIFC